MSTFMLRCMRKETFIVSLFSLALIITYGYWPLPAAPPTNVVRSCRPQTLRIRDACGSGTTTSTCFFFKLLWVWEVMGSARGRSIGSVRNRQMHCPSVRNVEDRPVL